MLFVQHSTEERVIGCSKVLPPCTQDKKKKMRMLIRRRVYREFKVETLKPELRRGPLGTWTALCGPVAPGAGLGTQGCRAGLAQGPRELRRNPRRVARDCPAPGQGQLLPAPPRPARPPTDL